MNKKLVVAVIMILVLPCCGKAMAAPPADIDSYVANLMNASGVPGMAVAIVENGEATYVNGFGLRRMGSPEKVDADTIFGIGSTSKAFTTAALGILVDNGKLGWDDKVIDHLPDFRLSDPWVTREITVRDLLVHRSGLGLGEGDLLLMPKSTYTIAQTVHQLRYLKPYTSFRSHYAYDNVLYVAAGQLIETVSGQSWGDYVRSHIFQPLGMTQSTVDDQARFSSSDRAWPHARIGGAIIGIGDQQLLDERAVAFSANTAPAGGIASSAHDMAEWLKVQLAHGALPDTGGRLFSETQADEMWKPEVPMDIDQVPEILKAARPQFSSYAMGWQVRDWRGHKIVWHPGGIIGFIAAVVLIPEKNTGFVIMMNSEEGAALKGLMYHLLDHYLGYGDKDWGKVTRVVEAATKAGALRQMTSGAPAASSKIGPALPLVRYAGIYRDAWYGPISVSLKKGKLFIDFTQSPSMVGTLEHWQYDTFRVTWENRLIEPAFIAFQLGVGGSIERAKMAAISPLADFSWDFQDLDLRRDQARR